MVSENLNLRTPPGFRGLDADLPIRVYRRRLPHWRQERATYFVTFRLADSIPQKQLRALRRWRQLWERTYPEPRSELAWEQLAREITRRTEAWLDNGYGECVFRNPAAAAEMAKSLQFFQGDRYLVSSFAVMPNHVHVVIRPLRELKLEEILDSMKGYVSRRVNSLLGRHGPLWEEESYDRIIRDEEHLFRVIQYIGRNPAKAGLPRERWVRWLHPEWEAAGWGFRDEF